MRALLFTIWIQSDKSVSATLAMLEQLTLAQFETVQQGGARMINASLSGKSFRGPVMNCHLIGGLSILPK